MRFLCTFIDLQFSPAIHRIDSGTTADHVELAGLRRYSASPVFDPSGLPVPQMSSATLKRALDLALELPETERAALAHDLLASLDGPPDADAQQAWENEITKRLNELESGKACTVDADEALRRIDTRLRNG